MCLKYGNVVFWIPDHKRRSEVQTERGPLQYFEGAFYPLGVAFQGDWWKFGLVCPAGVQLQSDPDKQPLVAPCGEPVYCSSYVSDCAERWSVTVVVCYRLFYVTVVVCYRMLRRVLHLLSHSIWWRNSMYVVMIELQSATEHDHTASYNWHRDRNLPAQCITALTTSF